MTLYVEGQPKLNLIPNKIYTIGRYAENDIRLPEECIHKMYVVVTLVTTGTIVIGVKRGKIHVNGRKVNWCEVKGAVVDIMLGNVKARLVPYIVKSEVEEGAD